MTNQERQRAVVLPTPATTGAPQPERVAKEPFVAPKLTFIAPKLTKQGRIETVTGITGTFFSAP